jgi:hypothetical protein
VSHELLITRSFYAFRDSRNKKDGDCKEQRKATINKQTKKGTNKIELNK